MVSHVTDLLRALFMAAGMGAAVVGWRPHVVQSTAALEPPRPPTPARAMARGPVSWYCRPGRSACTVRYPASGSYAAAGPVIRARLGGAWRGQQVTVTVGSRRVTVRLVDWCSCPGGRLLDLYSSAFGRLAPLSVGTVTATVVRR